jgi:phage tail sheath protein FI
LAEPNEAFQRCVSTTLDAPMMGVPTASRGRVMLAWTDPAPSWEEAFQLQLAYEPEFALPAVIYQGPNPYFELWSDPSRTAYFRVRATSGGLTSPWSNTAVAASEQAYARYVMNTPPVPGVTSSIAESELLKIHQAMIRLCAARGDVFAFLGLPRSYDAGTCVLYRNQLTSLMRPENGDSTLSYAAIYFPWLIVRDSADDQPGAVRVVSPEGSVVGSTAAVTISSGAWYAANQSLKGVVDLVPALEDGAALLFFNNRLNLAVQDARGFLPASSFTLSTDSQLTEINVRRLLILLRRLALQEGVDYVFQSNDPTFRRIVRRRFEEVLGGLFQRGAFAGSTAHESFRVRTDGSVNPPESVALGRFIIEVKVAPSLPLEFLTVRLLQTGGDLAFSEV